MAFIDNNSSECPSALIKTPRAAPPGYHVMDVQGDVKRTTYADCNYDNVRQTHDHRSTKTQKHINHRFADLRMPPGRTRRYLTSIGAVR